MFNDIACAVKGTESYKELFEGEEKNVLIVDLDVHQGNGTAKIFESDKNVIAIIHGDRIIRGRQRWRFTISRYRTSAKTRNI